MWTFVSLAVLADTRESFRPATFRYQRWGCELVFSFPTTKLIGWEAHWETLTASDNVFALVVMAQIQAKRVKNAATRKDTKIALTRLLFERGYSREQVVRLFNIIDWMIQLPKVLEPGFAQAVFAIQEEKNMPYVNTIERLEREKERLVGQQEGLQEGRKEGLKEARIETARNLLSFGVLTDEQISKATGLPLDEVMALRVEHKH